MLQIYIRQAGPWNAKTWALSSQFGHIMLRIGDEFYSFNQSQFLEHSALGCVQIIDKKAFATTYAGQVWQVVTTDFDESATGKIATYFRETASRTDYSLRNNCTLQCQRGLEAAGATFSRDFIFPGNVLRYVRSGKSGLPVRSVERVVV